MTRTKETREVWACVVMLQIFIVILPIGVYQKMMNEVTRQILGREKQDWFPGPPKYKKMHIFWITIKVEIESNHQLEHENWSCTCLLCPSSSAKISWGIFDKHFIYFSNILVVLHWTRYKSIYLNWVFVGGVFQIS